MTWTRLEGTSLWELAKDKYSSDSRRKQHNWDHVLQLYHHAEHTFGLAYDPALDRSIIGHDVIYDEHPEKEKRSSEWLLEHDEMSGATENAHIMKTATHVISDDNRMILLDLADFMFDESVLINRKKVEAESIALYGINKTTFAHANAEFLQKMLPNYAPSKLSRLPVWERDAFTRIRSGLQATIDLSRAVLTQ